jgi:hypothetical protein
MDAVVQIHLEELEAALTEQDLEAAKELLAQLKIEAHSLKEGKEHFVEKIRSGERRFNEMYRPRESSLPRDKSLNRLLRAQQQLHEAESSALDTLKAQGEVLRTTRGNLRAGQEELRVSNTFKNRMSRFWRG